MSRERRRNRRSSVLFFTCVRYFRYKDSLRAERSLRASFYAGRAEAGSSLFAGGLVLRAMSTLLESSWESWERLRVPVGWDDFDDFYERGSGSGEHGSGLEPMPMDSPEWVFFGLLAFCDFFVMLLLVSAAGGFLRRLCDRHTTGTEAGSKWRQASLRAPPHDETPPIWRRDAHPAQPRAQPWPV